MKLIHHHPLTEPPMLSICVPTWNRCDQLRARIEAIVPHLSPAVELVVVENGSTDGTAHFLADTAVRHAGMALSFWSNEANLGADVNYLRALELGRGRWLWLLGDDDDAFDFARLDQLCAALATIDTDTVLLRHPGWHLPAATPVRLNGATLLHADHDVLALSYLHIGMFVIRRDAALRYMRQAYSSGIGNLHAYSVISLGLLADGGDAGLLEVPGLFLDPPPRAVIRKPRWSAMSGHWGAWRAFEAGLPDQVVHIRRRQSRLRAKTITRLALADLAREGRAAPGLTQWMRKSFTAKYRLAAWSVWIADTLPRPAARLLGKGALRALRVGHAEEQRNIDY